MPAINADTLIDLGKLFAGKQVVKRIDLGVIRTTVVEPGDSPEVALFKINAERGYFLDSSGKLALIVAIEATGGGIGDPKMRPLSTQTPGGLTVYFPAANAELISKVVVFEGRFTAATLGIRGGGPALSVNRDLHNIRTVRDHPHLVNNIDLGSPFVGQATLRPDYLAQLAGDEGEGNKLSVGGVNFTGSVPAGFVSAPNLFATLPAGNAVAATGVAISSIGGKGDGGTVVSPSLNQAPTRASQRQPNQSIDPPVNRVTKPVRAAS